MSQTQAVGGEAAQPSIAGRRRGWRVAATVAVGAITWTWLARNADLRTFAKQLGLVSPWVWVAAAFAQVAGYGLRAWRLQSEWRDAGQVQWLTCLRLVLLHNAAVLMLPLRSGEAGYLWLVRRHWGVSLRAATFSLLRWRIQDACVLGVLAAALLVPLSAGMRVVALALCGLVLAFALPRAWSWLSRRHLPQRPEAAMLWRGLPVTALQWSSKLLGAALLLSQLAGLAWDTAARAAVGGELGTAQPLQPPAGLGVYEGGVWIAGGAPQGATLVSAALAAHAFALCVALGAAALAQLLAAASTRKNE